MITEGKYMNDLENADITLIENFFTIDEADYYFEKLEQDIEWKQEAMNMFGKQYQFARLTAWYGEPNKPYTFSGITLNPNDWNSDIDIIKIRDKVNDACEETFNSVLLNLYRDGNDHISWHSDNEKELGTNPTIASISLGCPRIFRIRRMDDHTIKRDIELNHGSLLIMKGETQHFWEHTVPPKSNKKLSLFDKSSLLKRINLTFRVM